MTVLETTLGIATGILVFLALAGLYLTLKYHGLWVKKQKQAFQAGGNQMKGDMVQVLGTFAALQEYEQLMLLSTTSKQGSLDLLGMKNDTVDFIEVKTKGAGLRGPERKLRRLVEEKKVRYVIKDIDLPPQFNMTERPE